MTFATARAELNRLSINRLAITGTSSSPNYAHAEKLLRQDALAILDKLEAAFAGQHRPSNCPGCGTPMTCCEQEEKDDE